MGKKSDDQARSLTFKVDRGADANNPNVDYLRLGAASDDAMYDGKTSVEAHGVRELARDGAVDKDLSRLGGGGRFVYSDGSSTTYIAGDDFARVSGAAYRSYGTYHEIVKDSDSKQVYKILGSRPLTPLDLGYGTYYELKRGTGYYLKANMTLHYESSVRYDCKLVGSISSELALKFAISAGPSASSTGVRFSIFGYDAKVDGSGSFKSSNSLDVSKAIRTLADEIIVLGLTDSISQGIWKGIWLTLLGLAQAANLAYVALNIGVTVQFEDIEEHPDTLRPWLTGMQIVAIAQAAIGLVFAASAMIKELYYANHGTDVERNLYNPVTGKPYVRLLQSGNGTVELGTGQGALIRMTGDELYIHASAIQIKAGGPAQMIRDGVNVSSHSGPLDCYATHRDGASFGSNAGKGKFFGQDVELNAIFGSSITSNGAKWTHNGDFETGNTVMGDLLVGQIGSNRRVQVEGPPTAPPTGWVGGEAPFLSRVSIMSSVSSAGSSEMMYAAL